jgi:hypothetical protein
MRTFVAHRSLAQMKQTAVLAMDTKSAPINLKST